MFARHLVIAAASVLCATAATAQTHGQLLERAIFAEDTAGDLNDAIRIYEQLASAPAVSPEIATRARARLSDARRERDLAAAASAAAAQQTKTQTGLPGQIDPPPTAPRTAPPAAPRNHVWGHSVVVTPRSIHRCVKTLRAKMEVDTSQPTYVHTIRNVGYRFEPGD